MLFIDYTKAFDKVDRALLINKMLSRGYNPQLVQAIKNLISNTHVIVDGVQVPTQLGTPQGSCLSPTLWSIYIADLTRNVNGIESNNLDNFAGARNRIKPTRALFFADDLIVFC